ncbi:hypothetical protein AVEN_136360-1 [Araneus ventricosus]|uniref:Uncharacterized protein n=1 Tax=Araneus ventricosus TaxID=182803 RepID=A0A4Y2E1D1_ARAVE|nr:hypothetical protein AVEN_136360-1 [Araneus ventricosus]
MVDKDISFSESIIFVAETKFNIFGSDGRISVWRKPNEELNPKNLLPTVKHGGGGIMVCCFWYGKFSFIENNMDQYKYPERKLENICPKTWNSKHIQVVSR